MKRRKVLGLVFMGSAASFLSYGGYKLLKLRNPDNSDLVNMNELISAISETIIPKTDTPGAIEADVSSYVITAVKDCLDKPTQANFIDGLTEVNEYAKDRFGKEFLECGEENKREILLYFDSEDNPAKGFLEKVKRKFLGDSFFVTMKKLTVEGYFTSEIGATKSMAYLPIPGYYSGCVELSPGQKAWAT